MDAAVEQLRALPADQREHDVLDEDVARLSPLKHANLNLYGRFELDMNSHLDLAAVVSVPGPRSAQGAPVTVPV
ncbi:hypothetical protein GCM10010371_69510 [Streptomyces subrutilus]|uniref:Tn3 transposase DDE domain-containing protein n=1 Tax=Streptomyces subrutilus TaxID=36818 RepID=A0A918RM32_9ACTN|nr:hypothetical protein GCM10010371_69510 [Streptomyces subrutilus]